MHVHILLQANVPNPNAYSSPLPLHLAVCPVEQRTDALYKIDLQDKPSIYQKNGQSAGNSNKTPRASSPEPVQHLTPPFPITSYHQSFPLLHGAQVWYGIPSDAKVNTVSNTYWWAEQSPPPPLSTCSRWRC